MTSVQSERLGFDAWWEAFSRTGDICPVRLGMSRDELRAILGDAHDVGGTSRRRKRPAIWWYEYGKHHVEFHFGPAGLELIYSDNEDGIVELCISRRMAAPD